MKAVLQICDDNDLGRDSVKYAPLSMIETLQDAAYQQMQAEVSQMTALLSCRKHKSRRWMNTPCLMSRSPHRICRNTATL